MMFSQWTVILIFLTLMQVKRQEGHFTYRLQCKSFGRVTQAVSTNFSVTLISGCKEGNDLYRCEIQFQLHTGVPANALEITTSPDSPRTNNVTMHAGLIISYQWTIIEDDGQRSVMFNLTISSSDEPVTVHLTTQYQLNCIEIQDLVSINFEGCDHRTEFGSISTSSEIPRYLDMGNISCRDKKSVSGRAVFSNGSEAVQTHCQADATWKDVNNITCLYLKAELRINGNGYSETVSLVYNQSSYWNNAVLLNCSIKDEATSGVAKFIMNNKLLNSSSITPHPNLNRKNISCYFENDFVKYFHQSTHTYSSTSTLNILFGPHPPNGSDSLCSFQNGSIAFYTNPPATGSWLSLIKGVAEVPSTITECCGQMYGVQGQMIAPRYNLNDEVNLSLRVNLSGHEYYTMVACDNMTTVSGDSLLIPIACFGAAMLLITIGLVIICWKRCGKENSNNDGGKVENSNPIHGTSDYDNVEPKSYEQVMNPLSGSTWSEQSDTAVYEVYSIENSRIEKGKNKSQEPTGDAKALYSVVY